MANPAIEALRQTMRRLEGGGRGADEIRPTGLAAIDAVLPGGGLARGALHEIMAAPGDEAAAAGFAASLLLSLAPAGPLLWCGGVEAPYGPGLARLGLRPERLVLVRVTRPADVLWAMEEGLRTPGLGAVLGDVRGLDLTASRRLQLAAEGSGVAGLVLSPVEGAGSTVAVTRWLVASAPSGPPLRPDQRDFGLARARWQVTLLRCRGAVPARDAAHYGTWWVEEGDAAGALPVAQSLADRPAAPAIARAV